MKESASCFVLSYRGGELTVYVMKKLNHNAVLIDDDGIEKIAMGKGIGFSAKVSKPFDVEDADKLFVLDSKEKIKRFSEIVSQIPIEFMDFAEEVIELITARISSPLDSNIYITLTDHIYFATQRKREDRDVTAIMLPEMRFLYPNEYDIAVEVVERINHRYQTELGSNEVGFITMHIINAELGEPNSLKSLKIVEMTTTILSHLEKSYSNVYDKESLTYHRLMVHIKFLVKRLIYQEETPVENIGFFTETFKHSKAYCTALKIKDIIEQQFQLAIQENEIIYLAIHLARIY